MKSKVFMVVSILSLALATHTLASSRWEFPRFGPWSEPINLGSSINTSSNDSTGNLSDDGLTMYFTSTRPGSLGEDIWVAKRSTRESDWEPAVNLGPVVNSASLDRLRSISADGKTVLFQSNRPGAFGGNDIWMSSRKENGDETGWSVPVNMGSVINTEMNELAANYFYGATDNMPRLFFSSSRTAGFGGADIYLSTVLPDGGFGAPLNLAELNSPFDETCMWIRDDGLEIVFSSSRPDPTNALNSYDLLSSTRSSQTESWSPPQNLGPKFNSQGFLDVNPQVSRDGTLMIFTSNRPGGFGGNDLYMSTRRKLRSAL